MPIWMLFVEWSARGILVLLMGLSVWSVSIMIQKNRDLPSEIEEQKWGDAKKDLFSALTRNKSAPALKLLQDSTLEKRFRAFWIQKKAELDSGLSVLATLSSTAPFIGLFGTVLGIIQAFGALSQNQNNTAWVMSGISEALIATAVGLFVAIPASVAFNVFQRRLKQHQLRYEQQFQIFLEEREDS